MAKNQLTQKYTIMKTLTNKNDWHQMNNCEKLTFLINYSMTNDIIALMKDFSCIEKTNDIIFELSAECSIPVQYIDAIAKIHNYDIERINENMYNYNFKSCLKL